MHVGLDLESLMCMNKIIPDLGLGKKKRKCSTVNANEQYEHRMELATWNTKSYGHCFCFSMQLTPGFGLISPLFSENKI